MKSNLIMIALLISLAFNIGFMIFVAANLTKPEPLMPNTPPDFHRTQIDGENVLLIDARRENIRIRAEFFKQLAKPEYDTQELVEITDRLTVSQHILEYRVTQHYLEMRRNMNDEEAQEYFSRLIRRHHDRGDREQGERRDGRDNRDRQGRPNGRPSR